MSIAGAGWFSELGCVGTGIIGICWIFGKDRRIEIDVQMNSEVRSLLVNLYSRPYPTNPPHPTNPSSEIWNFPFPASLSETTAV